MAEKMANPSGYGRLPDEQGREALEARQKAKLNASKNTTVEDGKNVPFITPKQSRT